jgi:16S rRNA (cytosine1402-N4)-methyltransferase
MTDFVHRPVMLDEIVGIFAVVPAGVILDATLGGGGHAEAILDSRADLMVLGVDRDPAALEAATIRLRRFGHRFRAVHARFDDLHRIMPNHIVRSLEDSLGAHTQPIRRPTIDEGAASDLDSSFDAHVADGLSGALFDLGVSSPQLDRADRGFSFRQSGPLDMRMDTTAPWSATDVVNGYDVDELARVIRRHGDERFATRIARAIVAARPVETTAELAAIVTAAIPAATRRTGGHPATRTFQAIRIEVNAELESLPGALDGAIEATRPGGRIAVLSYHSGEDRIAKERFRVATGACDCPPGLPCVCGAVQTVRLVRHVPKRATQAEREANPRAASARLRVAERIAPLTGDAKDGR